MGPLELAFSAAPSLNPAPRVAPAAAPQPPLGLPPLLPGGPGARGRVLLGAGAAVAVTGLRGVRLGGALELPPPPPAFLAGVWGRRVGAAAPAPLSSLDGTRTGRSAVGRLGEG